MYPASNACVPYYLLWAPSPVLNNQILICKVFDLQGPFVATLPGRTLRLTTWCASTVVFKFKAGTTVVWHTRIVRGLEYYYGQPGETPAVQNSHAMWRAPYTSATGAGGPLSGAGKLWNLSNDPHDSQL